ncbi:hypothetical protein BC829DRAFT_408008 [Chytridium lagenaria]|nr:hypothetical protein BC829DRAFT_408008 [Chytridium lagenaria]
MDADMIEANAKLPKTKPKPTPILRSKRSIQRAPTLLTDIYISRKSVFPALLKRAIKLLKSKNPFITIHGMGAAVNKAIEVALKILTSTVELVDDVVDEEEDEMTVERRNSAIHIKIYKI